MCSVVALIDLLNEHLTNVINVYNRVTTLLKSTLSSNATTVLANRNHLLIYCIICINQWQLRFLQYNKSEKSISTQTDSELNHECAFMKTVFLSVTLSELTLNFFF